MHPNQFQVNEAWIVFTLNDAPIQTDRDGLFNCVCLMDAASCFILGSAFVAVDEPEPSVIEFRRLLETGWAHKQELPATLFVPIRQFQTNVPEEAERQGIAVIRVAVIRVKEGDLIPFYQRGKARVQTIRESAAVGALQLKLQSRA